MFENIPYTNFHDLNMDWIITVVKDLLSKYSQLEEAITSGIQSIDDKTQEGLSDLNAKMTELEGLLDQWYQTHSQDIANALEAALISSQEAFSTFAEEKARQAAESIPEDYTELSYLVQTIKNSTLKYTKNIFNAQEAPILNGYVNAQTLQLVENENCRFTYLDVTAYRGQTIRVFSPYRTYLQLSRFTVEPTISPTVYATGVTVQTASAKQFDRTLSIAIRNEDSYLGIWYWYGDYNFNLSDTVLKNLMVYIGSIDTNLVPYLLMNVQRNGLSTEDYETSPYVYADFPRDNSANDALYMNNFRYPKGFVKEIHTYFSAEGDATACIVNSVNGAVLKKYVVHGTGDITIPVNEYVGVPFYLAIGGTGASYISTMFSATDFSYLIIRAADIPDSGDYTPINFPALADNAATYIISQKIVYASVYDSVYPTRYTNSMNKLFVAGDSITAGHKQYVVGEHWWEAVCREYGYKPIPAARSGSGFSYYNGMNACKIIRNQSFDDVGVAVIAYGTNDYGNSIEIGTIDDTYTYTEDSSQTFYACVKYVIETILQRNPHTTLILSLPINRSREGTYETGYAYGTPNSRGYTLLDYCNAIIACCNKYGINYVDNTRGSFNYLSLPHLFYDGLHPTSLGYKKLGQDMTAKVGALIRPYPEYDGIGGYGQF